MHEQSRDDSSTPQIYQSKPQGWLRRLHATADLGKSTQKHLKVMFVFPRLCWLFPSPSRSRGRYTVSPISEVRLCNGIQGLRKSLITVILFKRYSRFLASEKAEAFSAKAVVEGFHSDEVFSKLEGMMNELFVRRANCLPNIP